MAARIIYKTSPDLEWPGLLVFLRGDVLWTVEILLWLFYVFCNYRDVIYVAESVCTPFYVFRYIRGLSLISRLTLHTNSIHLILQQGGDLMNDCKIPVKITGVDEAIEKAKELEAQLNKTKALAAELEEQLKGFTVVIQM